MLQLRNYIAFFLSRIACVVLCVFTMATLAYSADQNYGIGPKYYLWSNDGTNTIITNLQTGRMAIILNGPQCNQQTQRPKPQFGLGSPLRDSRIRGLETDEEGED